jgi:hypothetical protein
MEYPHTMSEKKDTQKTSQGEEIPVPKRGDFTKNLRKIAKKDRGENGSTTRRPEK